MAEKMDRSTPASLPLARLWRLKELPGLVGKHVEIPAGRTGVALYPDGGVRTFAPGKHRLLSALDRLKGKGVGLLVGYIPAQALNVRFRVESLLSGDGELLDGTLICGIAIADVGRFFREVVVPQGEIRETGIDLDPQLLDEALGGLTTQYAASDLVSDRLSGRLSTQVQSLLDAVLGNQGMHLEEIRLLTLARAANRAVIAEKAQKLAERLQEVELQKKMAEIETQAQLDDFMQQVDPDLEKVAHLQLGGEGKGTVKGSLKGKVAEAIRSWLTVETEKKNGKRRWRIEGLFQRRKDAEEKAGKTKVRRTPRYWWLPRVLLMTFMILVGLILTAIINQVASAVSWDNRLEVQLIIWGVVIGVTLESIKWLYEKRESYSEETWLLPGFQHLDNLVGNDRQWADELVREQCARELLHVREVLSEVRSREYKRGRTELAIKLKNELESNAEQCAKKIKRMDFGCPPYVTDLNVGRRSWEHMLDIDEDLLLSANTLSDKAHLIQQRSHAGELTEVLITGLDGEISKFCNRFFERGRPLQVPPSEENSH